MIKPEDLRDMVITPSLKVLARFDERMNSQAAVDLLLGTAGQESRMGYNLIQENGPALGIYQIEPATHDSIWDNYLAFRPELASIVRSLASQNAFDSPENRSAELIGNLYYATAIARIKYWMVPDPMPQTLEQRALYWKSHYNTVQGRGTPQEFIENYERYVL